LVSLVSLLPWIVQFAANQLSSELQLQSQLHRARAADLIERVEARTVASGQAAGQRLRRLAEERVGQVVVWRTEVRVVEEIEELAPESEPHLVDQVKFPLKRDIGLPGSETAQYIAPKSPCCPVGGGVNAAGLNALPPGNCDP